MNLTPEEREIGRENFYSAIGSDITRREFLMGGIAVGAVSGAGLGAIYFGYDRSLGDPVRIGIIGTGDEGGVLIGAHTPSFVEIRAIADIRPYNVHRAFHGDQSSANTLAARPGLMSKYGWSNEEEAKSHIDVYEDYHELLARDDIEGVIIALPLHLHAQAAIDAMRAGKHVLTEKLMAHSVHQCKEMGRVSAQTMTLLATGHQRHYSILYDNAVDTIRRGLLGDLHHIRAQWHRGNLPGRDSWQQPLPDDRMVADVKKVDAEIEKAKGARLDALLARKRTLEQRLLDREVDAAAYGYQEKQLIDRDGSVAHTVSPLEELIRWRLWHRTGGGLMAELGSHQLDASGIFISAMRDDGKKALPLSVGATGGRQIFPYDRDVEDHVYCMYEYPAPGYEEDPNKKIVVTYSSINGNGFGGYGEVVLGTEGTLILEREKEALLFKTSATATKVSVAKSAQGKPTLDTTESPGDAAVGLQALSSGPISRGYTEEIEHWAWCIRNRDPANLPKCHPSVALADAVIALTTNIAIRENRRIEFQPGWFDIDSDETPEEVAPSIAV